MMKRTSGNGLHSLFFWPVSAIKETENIHDIREEVAAEKTREKKPVSRFKQILIAVAVFLVLAIPTLTYLFWTLSGYFANKLPG